MKKYNLIVTTPISHLDGILKLLKNNFNLTYLEDPTEDYLVKNIKKFHAIFTNPNQSKFFLGKKILSNAINLKIIATASTDLNHIDLKYIKKNKIDLISLTKEFKVIKKIPSTAELALSLTLSSIRNIYQANLSVRRGL